MWSSKQQPIAALSSTKTKYCALVEGPKESTWLKRLSIELGFLSDEPTQIWCNNISALKIVENSIFHAKT